MPLKSQTKWRLGTQTVNRSLLPRCLLSPGVWASFGFTRPAGLAALHKHRFTQEDVMSNLRSQEYSGITTIPANLNNQIRNFMLIAFSVIAISVLSAGKAAALYCQRNGLRCVPWTSPIVIDTDGKGYHLTSAEDGVLFDIAGDGHPIQMAWTAAGSTKLFLTLPKDGEVTNGKELFGNFTPQPPSSHPNGFLALAVYDQPENGGNGDGVIDEKDEIFSSLRLWIDANHDGVSQPEELHTLPELGVFSISLHYAESRREDQYGNLFRYWSRINLIDPSEDDSHAGPIAYDVFFR